MASADLRKLLEELEVAAARKTFRKFDFFKPYPKQKLFFDLGAIKRERLFMAGNQVGKSESGAFETAVHLTGEYPDWWAGKRFSHPVKGWMAGETSLVVRDVQQKKLCGEPGVDSAFGTGLIPKERFVDKPSLARGVTDAFDTIQVEHSNYEVPKGKYIKVRVVDGVSVGRFKSYEQGRTKFQGETIDFGWGDEEGPMDVYEEFVTRLTGEGIILTTFTPLLGKTDLVLRFEDPNAKDRAVVNMTLDEAEHFTAEEKATRLAGYRKHMRDARAKGVPLLGSGRVFDYDEELIKEAPIDLTAIPTYWKKLWGVDFGIGHPFAAVLMIYDADNDVIHIIHAIRLVDDEKGSLPIHHAAAMKPIGAGVPVAWPQDGTARDKGSGDPIADIYRKQGLIMLPEHATFVDGSISTEAGIMEMDQRMATGRLKVAAHLSDWFEEYRTYHRKDGQIVKVRDDLMSATRVAVMAKRFARAVPLGGVKRKRQEEVVNGVDFDLF